MSDPAKKYLLSRYGDGKIMNRVKDEMMKCHFKAGTVACCCETRWRLRERRKQSLSNTTSVLIFCLNKRKKTHKANKAIVESIR